MRAVWLFLVVAVICVDYLLYCSHHGSVCCLAQFFEVTFSSRSCRSQEARGLFVSNGMNSSFNCNVTEHYAPS